MNRIILIALAAALASCASTDYLVTSEEREKPTRFQTLNYNTGELEYWRINGNRAYNYTTGEFGSVRAR